MLRIVNLEEIQKLLCQVSGLVDGIEGKNSQAIEDVRNWLIKLELTLENNRLPLTANIAVLRGVLDSSKKGAIPAGIVFHERVTIRKIREVTASDVVKRAVELVSDAIENDNLRVAEAERIGQQLVTAAKFKGYITSIVDRSDHIGHLKSILSLIEADTDLVQAAVHLRGLVGANDALIVLDRGLARNQDR